MIPIGSNEQHGPTGLLGTDWLCPEIIAHEAQKTGDILVAPTFNIGMAQHHLDFPGTIALRPSTFMLAIGDWVPQPGATTASRRSISSTATAATSPPSRRPSPSSTPRPAIAGRNRGFACKLKNWWDLKGVTALANRQFPVGHGSHATPSEIAVTQWAYPDAIKTANYAPQIAPTGPIREAADFRARYADGRMGSDPGLATPEKGGELVKLAARPLLEDVAAFGAETAPPDSPSTPGDGWGSLRRVDSTSPVPHLHRPGRTAVVAHRRGSGHARRPSRRNSAPWPAHRMWRASRVR